ncbi:MAG TPA: ABC transporter ATP-binding protein [Acidimicrobiia bacterium]|jgi:ABC-2 type transport system ATP-binding protein|nr:ABC transporter ATP-binding protein [Acidimicrobiia bacterium]
MTEWTFTAEAVSKSYDGGKTYANRDVSIRVEPGEVYGLLGPNGAGKSTLVKQIIGLLKPDSGSIRLGPHDLVADPAAARQLCSYLPQAPMPIEAFRMKEAVRLSGEIRGGRRRDVEARGAELIESLQIQEWESTLGARLSGGVRRLVGFVMVTVVPGRLVILDEPTNDVDPLRRRLLWDEIRRLGSMGVSVILVTHNVLEAEKSVDRLAVIADGQVLAEGTPSSLKQADRGRLRLQVMLAPGVPTPPVPDYVREHSRVGNNLIGVIDETRAGEAIQWAQAIMEAGTAEEYALGATTLEDAYIRLTGHVSQEPEVAA